MVRGGVGLRGSPSKVKEEPGGGGDGKAKPDAIDVEGGKNEGGGSGEARSGGGAVSKRLLEGGEAGGSSGKRGLKMGLTTSCVHTLMAESSAATCGRPPITPCYSPPRRDPRVILLISSRFPPRILLREPRNSSATKLPAYCLPRRALSPHLPLDNDDDCPPHAPLPPRPRCAGGLTAGVMRKRGMPRVLAAMSRLSSSDVGVSCGGEAHAVKVYAGPQLAVDVFCLPVGGAPLTLSFPDEVVAAYRCISGEAAVEVYTPVAVSEQGGVERARSDEGKGGDGEKEVGEADEDRGKESEKDVDKDKDRGAAREADEGFRTRRSGGGNVCYDPTNHRPLTTTFYLYRPVMVEPAAVRVEHLMDLGRMDRPRRSTTGWEAKGGCSCWHGRPPKPVAASFILSLPRRGSFIAVHGLAPHLTRVYSSFDADASRDGAPPGRCLRPMPRSWKLGVSHRLCRGATDASSCWSRRLALELINPWRASGGARGTPKWGMQRLFLTTCRSGTSAWPT